MRSTSCNYWVDFCKDNSLEDDGDMYEVVKVFVELMRKLGVSIPMRSDHGHQMLDGFNKKTNLGYSVIDRLRGLAEFRSLELGISRSLASV